MPTPFRSVRVLWTLFALCLCAAAPAAATTTAQAQPAPFQRSELELRHLAETRVRYAQPSWRLGAVRAGLANELALPGWVAGALQSDEGLLTRSFRSAADAAAPDSFVLESRVEDSVQAAHERLLGWLAGLQSAQRMPGTTELGLFLGEAGFVGRSGAGPRALAWIAFVRGNVAVRLSAIDARREPELDLAAIAASVDAAILAAPELEAGRAPAKPVIEELRTRRASIVAGTSLPLDLAVVDPARGRPHLQWVVGGPGQGYVEQASNGAWEFHPTGPGRVTLALEATGSTGTWTRREFALDVLDD